MDHSVNGYLRRLSSEKLEAFLVQLIQKEQHENYQDVVKETLIK